MRVWKPARAASLAIFDAGDAPVEALGDAARAIVRR